MTGLLASQGLRVSQAWVGEALKQANPLYHYKRNTSTAKLMNPVRYSADYFGHKVHVDQNEKLAMYGVTHVCARDGYSGKVVGFITMPVKNKLQIYANLFRCLQQAIIINLHIIVICYNFLLVAKLWTVGSNRCRQW